MKKILSIPFLALILTGLLVAGLPILILCFIMLPIVRGIKWDMMIRLNNNLLLGIDQYYNVLMFGDPDETISSRDGRRWHETPWAKFINLLFWWQKDHTKNAIETDENYKRDLIP